jgi:hypothetical protein
VGEGEVAPSLSFQTGNRTIDIQLWGHGAGPLRGSFRSRVRRGKSAQACSSNSCFAWPGLGFASIQLHAEHPQAAKLLSSSRTICLAMVGHSPTGWDGVLGQFGAGLPGQNVVLLARIEHTI